MNAELYLALRVFLVRNKAKNSRNRGCAMKYPWIRNEITVDA